MAATTSKRKATQPVSILRVTYSTSSIGVEYDQKDTVRRLGLQRLGQTVEHAGYAGRARDDPQGAPSGDGGRDSKR